MMRQSAVVLFILLMVLVACNATEPQGEVSPTPTEAALSEFLLLYSREGGIAGFCDTLTVRLDEAILERCTGEGARVLLDPALQQELEQLARQYAAFETTMEDNPGGADNMTQRLSFNGVGEQVAGEDVKNTLYQIAADLLIQAGNP